MNHWNAYEHGSRGIPAYRARTYVAWGACLSLKLRSACKWLSGLSPTHIVVGRPLPAEFDPPPTPPRPPFPAP